MLILEEKKNPKISNLSFLREREYSKQLYANTFNNINKMKEFFERHKHQN